MALKDIRFKPGFFTDDTARDVGQLGYWKDGDKVRFMHNTPELMSGWQADSATEHMEGTARGTVDWLTTRQEQCIGFGTSVKLYVWIGGLFYDITPVRASSTINNNPFATTDTSAVVTVTDTGHGATDGAYVTFSGAAAVAGITIDGEYVLTYVDDNSYTITHSSSANATTSGGGAAVTAAYQINPGAEDSASLLGWGIGAYDEEAWGTPRAVSSVVAAARTWSLSTWGEDLIASHVDGSVYVWDSSVGTGTRAAIIAAAPTSNKAVFMSQEARHLVALGAGGDPLLIEWCSSEDYTDWTPTTTNTAGDKRVDQGNALMCAVRFRDGHLVFTDTAVYAMKYVGPPYTFAVVGEGVTGLLQGPNAAVVYNGVGYWMAAKNFYSYDGRIQPIPCPVLTTVFEDINPLQGAKVWAGANTGFDEVWWLYCSEGSTEIDRYVIFNVVERHWVFGTLARTLYVGDSDVLSVPYAVSADGYLYYHDTGTSADGAALSGYIESGDVEIAAGGEQFMHISKAIPDFDRLVGTATMTITTKKYPGATETQASGPHDITSTTEFINPRVRGRQMSVKVASNSTTASWRLGTLRLDLRPHGRR